MRASAVTLGYGPSVIRVASSDAAALAWLREFLGPDFDERPGATADAHVSLVIDAAAFATCRELGPPRIEQHIGMFALDGDMVTMPVWNVRDDGMTAIDPAGNVFYRRTETSSFEVIAESNRGARQALFRSLREVATASAMAAGALPIHGAAFAWRDRGYLVAGPKTSGKTTLLLHLLRGTGAKYVSNDRAVVWAGHQPPLVQGIPTIVSVRRGSLELLSGLADAFDRTAYQHRLSIDEAHAMTVDHSVTDRSRSRDVTPAQLAHLLHVERTGAVPLAGILLPRRTGEPGGIVFDRISPRFVADRLQSVLFRSGSVDTAGPFFCGHRGDGHEQGQEVVCAAVAAAVPMFEVALGMDAYLGAVPSRDTLEALHQQSEDR